MKQAVSCEVSTRAFVIEHNPHYVLITNTFLLVCPFRFIYYHVSSNNATISLLMFCELSHRAPELDSVFSALYYYSVSSPRKAGQSMTNILVVEDNAGLRRLIGIHLRRAGYEVSRPPTGRRRSIFGAQPRASHHHRRDDAPARRLRAHPRAARSGRHDAGADGNGKGLL